MNGSCLPARTTSNNEMANGLAGIARREINCFLEKKGFAGFVILGPVLFALLMVLIFRYGVIHSIPVAVWDNDKSSYSRELISMFDATSSLSVTKHVHSQDEGMRLIREGVVNSLIIIPESFSADLLSGKGATVAGRYNNQFMTQGGGINKAFSETVLSFAAKYDSVSYMREQIPHYALEGFLQPIKVRNILLFNPSIDYSWFLLLGTLPVIWQLFGICAVIYMFGLELRQKPAELAAYKGKGLMAAKLAPYAALFFVQFMIIQFLLFVVVGVPLKGSFLLISLGMFLFILSTLSVGAAIIAVTSSLSTGLSGASVYVSPAFAFAGITFPYEAMPALARFWSELLPLTHYHRILVDISMRNAPASTSLSSLAFLAAIVLVTYPLASFMYKRRLGA